MLTDHCPCSPSPTLRSCVPHQIHSTCILRNPVVRGDCRRALLDAPQIPAPQHVPRDGAATSSRSEAARALDRASDRARSFAWSACARELGPSAGAVLRMLPFSDSNCAISRCASADESVPQHRERWRACEHGLLRWQSRRQGGCQGRLSGTVGRAMGAHRWESRGRRA